MLERGKIGTAVARGTCHGQMLDVSFIVRGEERERGGAAEDVETDEPGVGRHTDEESPGSESSHERDAKGELAGPREHEEGPDHPRLVEVLRAPPRGGSTPPRR